MAASEAVGAAWRDPWPSAQPAWPDPPWLLRGRAITGWFDAPWAVLEAAMSPDLRPPRSATVRTRLRFYELEFEALEDVPGQPLVERAGRFREGAVGFPSAAAGVAGESSLFLWTDSDTYLMWAREAFGWPVLRAEIELAGGVWGSGPLEGAQGGGSLRDELGSASLEVRVEGRSGGGSPAAPWLTPRRVLRRAGLDGEARELLVVRPVVRSAGSAYAGSGRATFAFPGGHPLHPLAEVDVEVDVADGFELVVGEDVEVL